MDFKEQLGTLIDAVLAGKDDEAKAAFHAYSVARTSALVTEGEKGVNPFADKDSKDKKDKKDDDKSDKKDKKDEDKSDKDDDKSDKKDKSDKDDDKSDKDDDKSDKDDDKKGGFVPFKKKDKKDDE